MKRLFLCVTLCVLPAFCQDDLKSIPAPKSDEPKSMEDLTKNGFFAVIDDTEAVFFPCTDKDSGKQKICTDKVPSMRMRIALLEDQVDKLEARLKALEEGAGKVKAFNGPSAHGYMLPSSCADGEIYTFHANPSITDYYVCDSNKWIPLPGSASLVYQ